MGFVLLPDATHQEGGGVNMKHTPAPWIREDFTIYKLNDEGYNRMCVNVMQHVNNMPIDEQVANAKLIAAAPDMYESLVWLLHLCSDISKGGREFPVTKDEWNDAWDSAIKAVKKAGV